MHIATFVSPDQSGRTLSISRCPMTSALDFRAFLTTHCSLRKSCHIHSPIAPQYISMPTNILIVGATGKQGGKALSSLIDSPDSSSSLSLRFLTRNPDSASAQRLTAQGAKAIKGDLGDAASLDAALAGVDRAFFVTDQRQGSTRRRSRAGTLWTRRRRRESSISCLRRSALRTRPR